MSQEQLVAIAVAAVAVFWMLGAYNRLVALRNDIGQAWATVEEALRQRGAALAALVAALREPLAAEQGALEALHHAQGASAQATVAMAARTVADDTAAHWLAAESALTAAASRAFALPDHHAEPRAHEPPSTQVVAWGALEPRLVYRRQKFNEAAFIYNEALAQFPTRLLVPLFGFRRAGRI